MKTIKEWLKELPEPYRSEAIENTDSSRLVYKTSMVKDTATALKTAFAWNETKEGFVYWMELYYIL